MSRVRIAIAVVNHIVLIPINFRSYCQWIGYKTAAVDNSGQVFGIVISGCPYGRSYLWAKMLERMTFTIFWDESLSPRHGNLPVEPHRQPNNDANHKAASNCKLSGFSTMANSKLDWTSALKTSKPEVHKSRLSGSVGIGKPYNDWWAAGRSRNLLVLPVEPSSNSEQLVREFLFLWSRAVSPY